LSYSNKQQNQILMTVEHFIKENRGTIVDVRTREEFIGGHVATSINIPINEIPERMEEIKSLATPLILCCASGGRSGQAEHYLSQQGIECLNGGSWLNVNFYQSLQNKID
jgi:phage shock protein E